MRPRLLDLFCGAGGAAAGYHRAGFDVIGVDIRPQPRYPFTFVQADALNPPVDLAAFDAIHASPPCQAYSAGRNMWKGRLPDGRHPDLVGPVRDLLERSGRPWVIENVPGAPLRGAITLCGDSFGLGVRRHRLFETSWFVWAPPQCRSSHPAFVASVFGGGALSRTPPGASRDNFMQRRTHVPQTVAKSVMGIDWMSRDELSQAIPPAYTEYIGRELLAQLAQPRV